MRDRQKTSPRWKETERLLVLSSNPNKPDQVDSWLPTRGVQAAFHSSQSADLALRLTGLLWASVATFPAGCRLAPCLPASPRRRLRQMIPGRTHCSTQTLRDVRLQ